MDAMRATLALGVRVEPHPFLTVGRKVRVKSGAMTGFEGVLVRRKRHARLIVSVSLIQRSMAMEIDEDDLEVVP
jgi:transcription antitermination factor NusG